ncbi:MAG TPA: NAD(P)H-hydrate dehydratase [Kofleriaceae bacterium]|nr:NAD(P)H-hydrate dehydratase [Kofleriaceae bacterium]
MTRAASHPITRARLRRWPLPRLDPARGKVTRGSLCVVGGSDANPGAILLAGLAALRAGAGTLSLATSDRHVGALAVAMPEARVLGLPRARSGELAARAAHHIADAALATDAIVVGPGMMDGRAGLALLRRCARAERTIPCVIDAAPLAALPPRLSPGRAAWILTPHPGEMAALCDTTPDRVLARPLELARDMARRYRAVVVLKGAVTYVAAPDGTAYHSTEGNLGLGTAGSGDVLAGVIGGLCARGATPLQAAVWAVHLHACAGDQLARRIGPLGFLASELLAEIPGLLARAAR